MRWDFLRLGVLGLGVGLCSGFYYGLLLFIDYHAGGIPAYLPGSIFGLGFAIIYWNTSHIETKRRNLISLGSTVLGGVCYWIAVQLTIQMTHSYTPADAMLPAGIAACVATCIMMFGLKILTSKYTAYWIALCSVAGGVLGWMFISSYLSEWSLVGYLIFFVGWQAPMIVLVGWPLIKNKNG